MNRYRRKSSTLFPRGSGAGASVRVASRDPHVDISYMNSTNGLLLIVKYIVFHG
jgi:hypothetical protein